MVLTIPKQTKKMKENILVLDLQVVESRKASDKLNYTVDDFNKSNI